MPNTTTTFQTTLATDRLTATNTTTTFNTTRSTATSRVNTKKVDQLLQLKIQQQPSSTTESTYSRTTTGTADYNVQY